MVRTIRDLLGGASGLVNSNKRQGALFENIPTVPVGESRVFAPGAFFHISADGQPVRVGPGLFQTRTCSRAGIDGGISLVAESSG